MKMSASVFAYFILYQSLIRMQSEKKGMFE